MINDPWLFKGKELVDSGFFIQKDVLAILGTDDEYQAFCRPLACVVCGDKDYSDRYPEGRCLYAHVRRANNSGKSIKPKYSGVPMTDKCHRIQSDHGESTAYLKAFPAHKNMESVELIQAAKDWFDNRVNHYLLIWSVGLFAKAFNIDSLTKLDPLMVRLWARDKGIEKHLPKGY